jgi:F0F1-type ATP synthase membrane subunit b/b'
MSIYWPTFIWEIINLALLVGIAYGIYRIYKAIKK